MRLPPTLTTCSSAEHFVSFMSKVALSIAPRAVSVAHELTALGHAGSTANTSSACTESKQDNIDCTNTFTDADRPLGSTKLLPCSPIAGPMSAESMQNTYVWEVSLARCATMHCDESNTPPSHTLGCCADADDFPRTPGAEAQPNYNRS